MKYSIIFLSLIFLTQTSLAQQQGIINSAESEHVTLKSINFGDCKWTEGFWADKFKIAEKSMIPYMRSLLTGT